MKIKLLFAILIALLIMSGCEKREVGTAVSKDGKPVPIKLGVTMDPECGMEVENMAHSSEVILKDGRAFVFDDPGCMIKWLHKNKYDTKDVKLWTYSDDTHRWIDAKKAKYTMTDSTPMHYGFGAYEKNSTKKKLISFEEMRLKMLRGENLTNPKIRKKLLGF